MNTRFSMKIEELFTKLDINGDNELVLDEVIKNYSKIKSASGMHKQVEAVKFFQAIDMD